MRLAWWLLVLFATGFALEHRGRLHERALEDEVISTAATVTVTEKVSYNAPATVTVTDKASHDARTTVTVLVPSAASYSISHAKQNKDELLKVPDRPCGWPKPSKAQWEKDNVTGWIEKQRAIWANDKRDTSNPHFINYLVNHYVPYSSAAVLTDCNLRGVCVAVDCKLVAQDNYTSADDQRKAWYFFDSTSKLHARLSDMIDMVRNASHGYDEHREKLISTFATNYIVQNYVNMSEPERQRYQERFTLYTLLAFTTASALAKTTQSVEAGWKAASSMVGAQGAQDGIVAAYTILRNTLHREMHTEKPNPRVDSTQPEVFVTRVADHISKLLTENARDLFKRGKTDMYLFWTGEVDFASNTTLAKALGSGLYVNTTDEVIGGAQVSQVFEKFFSALAINYFWRKSAVWITWAPTAPHGDCESDKRGILITKVCLEEYPRSVLFLNFLKGSNFQPNDQPKHISPKRRLIPTSPTLAYNGAWVHIPPGLKALRTYPKRYGNVTVEDIVRHSIVHYNQSSFEEIKDLSAWAGRATDALAAPPKHNTADHLMAALSAGLLFNIPVARSPYGQAIPPGHDILDYQMPVGSDYKHLSTLPELSRNFPCRVGNINVTSDFDGSVAPPRDESTAFINATGLYRVGEFWEGCINFANCQTKHTTPRHFFQDGDDQAVRDKEYSGDFYNCFVQKHAVAPLQPWQYTPGPWNDWNGTDEASEWEDRVGLQRVHLQGQKDGPTSRP
ncbi:uncharacterized protein BDZ99DRAFT_494508 [Mytilinidion resinicola]|uniref:Chondroitin AC/alginate lyase n=1 Tax=Mytilinidion resinicola TaxID=574789 RepID=A0A6A6Z2S8_9PEZI|nr:uncharacterized protein BDZ99DRAFT_494508 [Mytilinidion resinicola]KAF2814537.1 hypothetical protein BDZ99DRAFT_494508 [Mytilinidion resinicola]